MVAGDVVPSPTIVVGIIPGPLLWQSGVERDISRVLVMLPDVDNLHFPRPEFTLKVTGIVDVDVLRGKSLVVFRNDLNFLVSECRPTIALTFDQPYRTDW